MGWPAQRMTQPVMPLRYLRRLIRDGSDMIPRAGEFGNLLYEGAVPRLLLGTYSPEDVEAKLEEYGIAPKLRQKGFNNLKLHFDLSNPMRHQVAIHHRDLAPENLLGEVHLYDGSFIPSYRHSGILWGRKDYMLYIQWLLLQNPNRGFTPQRPALPGQRHPGLKVGREVMAMLVALATRMNMAGIINIPEFPHAALLYSELFRYFNPRAEGIMRAIVRDLKPYPLYKGSWGIMLGCVTEAHSRKPFVWFKEEQILPLSEVWREHFESRSYQKKVDRAYQRHHFVFHEDLWESFNPLNPDGSPKNPLSPLPFPMLGE